MAAQLCGPQAHDGLGALRDRRARLRPHRHRGACEGQGAAAQGLSQRIPPVAAVGPSGPACWLARWPSGALA